jgi:cell fate regulator YaaT (PSP1 superfamily)
MDELQRLKNRIEVLEQEYYRNNFKSFQEFNKTVHFNSRLKVPHYDTLPTTCEIGEIAESGGELNICSATNTWTVVGTQT